MSPTGSAGFVLRLERTLPAPRAAAYRALTEPERLAEWWGPHGFTVPSAEFAAREGAGYRIAMQPPDGDRFYLLGEVREAEPPARLVYTFRWDPPTADDRETLVELALEERGEETVVRLTQGKFATEERHSLHEAGWAESLQRLERLLRDESE